MDSFALLLELGIQNVAIISRNHFLQLLHRRPTMTWDGRVQSPWHSGLWVSVFTERITGERIASFLLDSYKVEMQWLVWNESWWIMGVNTSQWVHSENLFYNEKGVTHTKNQSKVKYMTTFFSTNSLQYLYNVCWPTEYKRQDDNWPLEVN